MDKGSGRGGEGKWRLINQNQERFHSRVFDIKMCIFSHDILHRLGHTSYGFF